MIEAEILRNRKADVMITKSYQLYGCTLQQLDITKNEVADDLDLKNDAAVHASVHNTSTLSAVAVITESSFY